MKTLLTISILLTCFIAQAQRIVVDEPYMYCYVDTVTNMVQCQSYYRGNYCLNVKQGYKYYFGMDLKMCYRKCFTFKNVPSVIEIRHKKKVTSIKIE